MHLNCAGSRRRTVSGFGTSVPGGPGAWLAIVLAALVLAAAAPAAQAQEPTTTWTGGSTKTANWSDGGNWSTGTAPPYGTIVFGNITQTATNSLNGVNIANQDMAAYNENQHLVEINSTQPYLLTGNPLVQYDYSGVQSKIENQGSGAVTIDMGIIFNSGNANSGANVAEINAVNGDMTFTANGTVALNGSNNAVSALEMYGQGHTITFNGVISGTGKYVQLNGANTIVFNAANTYDTGTNIFSGTIRANAPGGASSTGTGQVNVNSGTLGGSGTVSGPVVVNSGGTVTAGANTTSIGVLSTGAQTWNGGGAFLDKVAAGTAVAGAPGTANDELVMTGLTPQTSAFTVALSSLGTTTLTSSATLTLATTASGTFNLADLTLTTSNVSAPTGYKIVLADSPSGGGDTLFANVVVTAAPEPTSLLLAGVGVAPLLARRRR